MTLYEIHQILADNRALIAHTWEFFLSVHLALFGIMFLGYNKASWISRGVLLILYIGFMYLNYRAQLDNYNYAYEILNYARSAEFDANGETLTQFFKAGWLLDYLLPLYGGSSLVGCAIITLVGGRKPDGSKGRDED